MARSLYKSSTLVVLTSQTTTTSILPKSTRLVTLRAQSTQSDSDQRDALAVQKIEDAIHGIIVRRSAPDWLPFLPGSSYWVPPRTSSSYGIAHLVDKLANTLTHDQVMSLTTSRGWPSSSFFLLNETTATEDEEN